MSVFDHPEEEQQMDDAPSAPLSVEEMLSQLLEEQKQHRAEVAQMRQELAEARVPQHTGPPPPHMTAEELHARRMEDIKQYKFYCPGCGELSRLDRDCRGECGRRRLGSEPIQFMPTDELTTGDPAGYTAAPHTDKLG